MTEHVWMATGNRRGKRSRYHTDRDCARLKQAKGIRRWEKSSIKGHYPICKLCDGHPHPGGATGAGHYASLLEAAESDD